MYAAVLTINIVEIQARLRDIQAELVSSYTVYSQVFDIKSGKTFVPPIYRSIQFSKLFQTLTESTAAGKSLASQHMNLVITKSQNQSRICLSSGKDLSAQMNIHLIPWQHEKMVEVLLAGGMEYIRSYEQTVKIYFYKELNTVFSVFQPKGIPAFLYVSTDKEESIIQSLAMLNISMDKTVNYTLKDIYRYYNIPICLAV